MTDEIDWGKYVLVDKEKYIGDIIKMKEEHEKELNKVKDELQNIRKQHG